MKRLVPNAGVFFEQRRNVMAKKPIHATFIEQMTAVNCGPWYCNPQCQLSAKYKMLRSVSSAKRI